LAINKASQDVTLLTRTLVSTRLEPIPSPIFGNQPGGLSLERGRFIASAGKEMIVDLNTTIQRVGTPPISTAYVKGPWDAYSVVQVPVVQNTLLEIHSIRMHQLRLL
jgi:hypothetical protein